MGYIRVHITDMEALAGLDCGKGAGTPRRQETPEEKRES